MKNQYIGSDFDDFLADQVKKAFGRDDLLVMNASADVRNFLEQQDFKKDVLLLMSSGNFDGIDLNAFGKELAGR